MHSNGPLSRLGQGRRHSFAFCVLLSAFTVSGFAAERPPNIVVFLADDLGWNTVGFNGGKLETPNIDRLAREGLRFDQFYAQSLCTQTRAALLTGRYPIRYGLQEGVIYAWESHGLSPNERTLAESLKQAGYRTAIVGKWHLGFARPEYLPTRQGFDHQYGSYTANIGYFNHKKSGALDWHRDDRPLREQGHATDLTAKEAVRLIGKHDPSEPLFLYVPFQAVHMPRNVPEKYLERFAHIESERWRLLAAAVSQMDDAVGAVLLALERRGMLDDTLVFFTCDNGTKYTAGKLRGGKAEAYEAAIRVPAALMWRGVLEGGRVITQPIHVTDVYPTLLGLAGVEPDAERPVDGVDVWPTIAANAPLPGREMLLQLSLDQGAVRVGDWKLIAQWKKGAARFEDLTPGKVELFNIRADPYESTDLAEANTDRVDEILDRLKRFQREAVPPLKRADGPPPPGFEIPEVWGPRPAD